MHLVYKRILTLKQTIMKKITFLILAALLLPVSLRAQYTMPWTQDFEGEGTNMPSVFFGIETYAGWYPYAAYTEDVSCPSSTALVLTRYPNNVVSLPEFPVPIDTLEITFMTKPNGINSGTFEVGYLPQMYGDTSAFVALATYNSTDTVFQQGCMESKTVTFSGDSIPEAAVIAFRFRPINYSTDKWYIDNIQVYIAGGCPGADSVTVSSITATEATLNIYNSNQGVGYIVYLNGTLVDTSYSSSFYLDSLNPATNYNVTIYELCDTSASGRAVFTSFSTDCNVSHVPFFDDFSSYQNQTFPTCYRSLNPFATPNAQTSYSNGDNGAYLDIYPWSGLGELLVLPSIETDNDGRELDVSFKCWSLEGGSVRVGIMTDISDSMYFIEAGTIVFDSLYSDNNYHEYHTYINPSLFNDTVRVALWFYGTNIELDDITIKMANNCHFPIAAWIDTVTGESATLRWQNEDGIIYQNYEVLYSSVYNWQWFMVPDTTMLTVGTDTSFTVTGLAPLTNYHFWLRTLCSDTSDWFYIGEGMTICPEGYNAPYYVDVTTVTDRPIPMCWNVLQSCSFSGRPTIWNPGDPFEFFNQYVDDTNFVVLPYIRLQSNNMIITMLADAEPLTRGLEVGYVTDPLDPYTFTVIDTVHSETPRIYDFLTSNVPPSLDTIYIAFRFDSRHAAHLYNILIDTIPDCLRPAELLIDTMGHDFADLTATSVNGIPASGYEVRYSTVNNFDSAMTTTVSSASFTIDSLLPMTVYYTWVRAICGSNPSPWREGPSFQTKCGPDACPLTIEIYEPNDITSFAMFTGCGINIYSDTSLLWNLSAQNTERHSLEQTFWVCPDMAPINLNVDAGMYGSYGFGWPSWMGINVTMADSTFLNYDATLYAHGATFLTLNNPCPTCSAVQNVNIDTVTTNLVTISWTPSDSTDNSFVIFLDTVAIDTVSNTTYTFTGLDDNTLYTFGVATNCSGSLATIITRDTATLCGLYEPCPIEVQVIDLYGGGAFFTNHVLVYSNNHVVGDVSSNMMAAGTVTEDVYVCSGDSVRISWVGFGASAIDEAFSINIIDGNGVWLAGGSAGNYSNNPNIISFMPYCQCLPPDSVTTVPDYNSITVIWGTSDSVEIQISNDESFYNAFDTITTAGTVTFDGLTHNTPYFIRLRTFCIADRISDWGDFIDTTLYDSTYIDPNTHRPCPAPEGLAILSTTYTTATIGWHPTGDEPQWEINVIVQGDSRLDTVADTVYTITNLWPELNNYVSVRALCGENHVEGEWSDTITFQTDICPPVPNVSIGIGDVTTNSASVSWQQMHNSLGYELYYGEPGFYVGEATMVSLPQETPFYTMENLEAESDYELFIINRCTETLNSATSDRIQFSTLAETGISTVESTALILAPNPTSDLVTLHIGGAETVHTVELIDMTGRTIRSLNAEGSLYPFDVRDVAQGTYFVRVTGESFTAVRKLVVK